MKHVFLGLSAAVVVCVGCAVEGQQTFDRGAEYVAPPASMLQRPGPMVDGPGPGVLPYMGQPGGITPASAQMPGGPMAGGPMGGPGCMPGGPTGGPGMYGPGPGAAGGEPPAGIPTTTQIGFVGPDGMSIGWQVDAVYAEDQLVTPARYNFAQGAVYRLKLSDIPGRQGQTLYPTLQVYPAHPETAAYLSHVSVPVELTQEDIENVRANNYVTKVIYLPDARFQDLAVAGVETLVSTKLDPGQDPVAIAEQRGTILVVFRVGNMDLEMPGRPLPGSAVSEIETPDGQIVQVGYVGTEGEFVAPTPIAYIGTGPIGVPHARIAAETGYAAPGAPSALPPWGIPNVGTPIGLPGPPHLPYGGPAGLRSHTVRNLTKSDLGHPVNDMLIDVKHNPGYRLPKPVSYVYYEENHPVHSAGEVKYPGDQVQPGAPLPPRPRHHGGYQVGPGAGYGAGYGAGSGGGAMVDPSCPKGRCPVGTCNCR